MLKVNFWCKKGSKLCPKVVFKNRLLQLYIRREVVEDRGRGSSKTKNCGSCSSGSSRSKRGPKQDQKLLLVLAAFMQQSKEGVPSKTVNCWWT